MEVNKEVGIQSLEPSRLPIFGCTFRRITIKRIHSPIPDTDGYSMGRFQRPILRAKNLYKNAQQLDPPISSRPVGFYFTPSSKKAKYCRRYKYTFSNRPDRCPATRPCDNLLYRFRTRQRFLDWQTTRWGEYCFHRGPLADVKPARNRAVAPGGQRLPCLWLDLERNITHNLLRHERRAHSNFSGAEYL